MEDHILDLTKASAAAGKLISASAFIDACQLLGDAQSQLSGVTMHSATKSYLKKKNLIATERDSTGGEFETYQDRSPYATLCRMATILSCFLSYTGFQF